MIVQTREEIDLTLLLNDSALNQFNLLAIMDSVIDMQMRSRYK